jgi:hypothetical protein
MGGAMAGCFGAFLGAIVGGVAGVGLGFAWTSFFGTTDFEGYSGMLVFLTFMPIGVVAGAMVGGVGLGLLAARGEPSTPTKDDSQN